MNIEQFDKKYVAFKSAEKINILCDHPDHQGPKMVELGKQPARRNILKNDGERFICRQCCMQYDNPMTKAGKGKNLDEEITITCPHPEHQGARRRKMKMACYYGSMDKPYQQVCGSCAQLGKEISEEQREKISETMTGRKLSKSHVANILKWRENNPEWAEKAKKNLIPGMGGIARAGLPLPEDWKQAISDATVGKPKTEEHCQNISEGRKKMLDEQGGFTREHRENISRATIHQYEQGFNPNLHHLKGYHESSKAGSVFYRSSYEKKAYIKLDGDDSVKTYKSEAIKTKFYNPVKGITSSYLIDILVEHMDGSEKLIEIKPASRLNEKINIAKIEAGEKKAMSLGMKFEVWTEMELFGHVYNERNMRSFVEKVRNGEV